VIDRTGKMDVRTGEQRVVVDVGVGHVAFSIEMIGGGNRGDGR